MAAGSGPVAIDAERASGYRYSTRAYLIQLRREGSTTALIDPIAFDTLDPLQEVIEDTEWILHAATQDLPCLGELGLRPQRLFDTELAGRLLGYPRVGLATLVETILGSRLAKEHSAVDWSTRPLPVPWLEYAALDVEVLIELRDALAAELEAAGKAEWARQEFDHLRGFEFTPRVDAWRRTSGLHRVRGRRALGGRAGDVGDPRPDRRAARRHPGPDPARLRPRGCCAGACRRTARPCCRPRASTDAAPSATRRAGSPRWPPPATCPRPTCPPARRAATARPSPGPGPRRTRSPPVGWCSPARRSAAWPRSTTCPPRTCSPPTTCGAPSGHRRTAARRPRSPRACARCWPVSAPASGRST